MALLLFKLKEERFRLDTRQSILLREWCDSVGVLGGCGCPIPGNDQDQIGWGPGKPALVLNLAPGNPACDSGLGN